MATRTWGQDKSGLTEASREDGEGAAPPPVPADTDRTPASVLSRDTVADAVATLPALPPPAAGDRYGLARLTALWLLDLSSDHSRRAYFRDLATWLSWCELTGLDPRRAHRADGDQWASTLTVTMPNGEIRPPAPKTLERRQAAVASWYQYLLTHDAADRNPIVRRRGTAAKPRATAPVLAEHQAAALLDHAHARAARNRTEASWRDAALVDLLFYTGVRLDAVTGARVEDITEEAGYPILRYTVKGGHRSFVRLVPEALDSLRTYLELRAARNHLRVDELTGRLLVTTPHPHLPGRLGGKPLTQRDVTNTLRALARQAGLPDPVADRISAHSGRGTVITTLLGNGVDLQRAQDLAEHADPRTTRGYDATNNKLARSPVTTLAAILARHRRPSPEDS